MDFEHTKFQDPPNASKVFVQAQKSFPPVLYKRVHQVPVRMNNEPAQRKPAKLKKNVGGKISKLCLTFMSKTNNLEAKEKRFALQKIVTARES